MSTNNPPNSWKPKCLNVFTFEYILGSFWNSLSLVCERHVSFPFTYVTFEAHSAPNVEQKKRNNIAGIRSMRAFPFQRTRERSLTWKHEFSDLHTCKVEEIQKRFLDAIYFIVQFLFNHPRIHRYCYDFCIYLSSDFHRHRVGRLGKLHNEMWVLKCVHLQVSMYFIYYTWRPGKIRFYMNFFQSFMYHTIKLSSFIVRRRENRSYNNQSSLIQLHIS